MDRKYMTRTVALLMALLMILSFSGCGRVDNTIAEPDEITIDYLTGEYADQLVRDGAEVSLGTVDLTSDANGSFTLTTNNMVVVESDITDLGYYVADSNISTTAPVDPTARITCIKNPATGPEIISLAEFAKIVNADNYDPLQEGSEQLFDVYTMNGTVLMVLARELPVSE